MNRLSGPLFAICLTLLVQAYPAKASEQAGNLRIEAGAGLSNQEPITLIAGVGYKSFIARVQGLGAHSGANDFWCGLRGSFLWTFFEDLPFNFDVGVGSGYFFAEAPNKMNQAINAANKARYLYPYNYKEVLDISLEIWAHLYGFYTQVSVPAYRFMEHDAPSIFWGAGYIYSF